MRNINFAAISGNLTRDAELRQTVSGTQVLSFGVAVNDSRKNQQTGEWEDSPNYIDCTMFGERAGKLAQYLTKGAKVFVAGKLRWSQWEAQSGEKRSKVGVVVDEIEFPARQGAQGGPSGQHGGSQAAQPPYGPYDDVPF